jgi:hypothetical protein
MRAARTLTVTTASVLRSANGEVQTTCKRAPRKNPGMQYRGLVAQWSIATLSVPAHIRAHGRQRIERIPILRPSQRYCDIAMAIVGGSWWKYHKAL